MLAFTSSATQAACNERDITSQLETGGFTFSVIDTKGNNIKLFELTKDGVTSSLAVESDDGDVSFRKYFTDDVRLATLNSINVEYRYVKVSRDEDGDIRIAYDYPHWGTGCADDLGNHIQLWYSLLDDVARDIAEKL